MGIEPTIAPAATEPVTVQGDVPCRKCQYNLRTLSVDGRCPECGTPVGFSIQGDLIRYSDPAWVAALGRGINLIIAAIVVTIFAMVAGVALRQYLSPLSQQLTGMLSYGLFLLGAWFLTLPDPSGLGEDRYGTSRKWIRILLGVGLANTFLQFVGGRSILPLVEVKALEIINIIAMFGSLAGHLLMLKYLSKLALRIPDEWISHRAEFLLYAIGISYGVSIIMAFAMAMIVMLVKSQPQAVMSLGCFIGIAVLSLLVFGFMYLLMLEKLGKRFKEQAAIARETWARSGVV